MTILFLDTEFTSLDQPNPDLISLGLVNEIGDFFYAELPPESYSRRASDWVRGNVLPSLWGGRWELPKAELSAHLVAWIEAQNDRAMIVTDAPDYDFALIKPLLNPWPRNLAKQAMLFDSYAMGVERQPWLSGVMAAYHASTKRPGHHALYDAQAHRAGMMAALYAGWKLKW